MAVRLGTWGSPGRASSAHALASEQDDCIASIESACAQVEDVVPVNEPDFTAYCSSSFIEMESAHSWAKLGRVNLAADVYSRSLATWPDSQRRDQALCTARLAVVLAGLGEIDRAASYGRRAADLVRRSPSARTLATLRAAAANVATYRKLDCVKDFQHSIEGLI
jgi:hypothetical protein